MSGFKKKMCTSCFILKQQEKDNSYTSYAQISAAENALSAEKHEHLWQQNQLHTP